MGAKQYEVFSSIVNALTHEGKHTEDTVNVFSNALRTHMLPVSSEPRSLRACIYEVLEGRYFQEPGLGRVLITELADDFTSAIDTDALRYILQNLVRNAYAHGGDKLKQIRIRLNASSHTLEVWWDDGQGIASSVLQQIFDLFYKSGRSGSTGLGLSLVREMVEAAGGAIRCVKAEAR